MSAARRRSLFLTLGGVAAISTAAVVRAKRKEAQLHAIAQRNRGGRNTELARLGLHWGAVQNARSNLAPSAASRSRLGDRTLSMP